jgi:hypothetical protein
MEAHDFRGLIRETVLAAKARAEELSNSRHMSSLHGRILVTGGAGFIGSALVWALNQRGHTRHRRDDFLGSDEKWKNLVPLKFADYVEADVLRTRSRPNRRPSANSRPCFTSAPARPRRSATPVT